MAKTQKKSTLAKVLLQEVGEPALDVHSSNISTVRLLNHYAMYTDVKNLKPWAIAWATNEGKKELVKKMRALHDDCFVTYGAVCRLLSRGYGFSHSPDIVEKVEAHFNLMYEKLQQRQVDANVQNAVKYKAPEITLEGDDALFEETIDVVLKSNTKPPKLSATKYIRKRIKEVSLDIANNAEAYSKRVANRLQKFLDGIDTTIVRKKKETGPVAITGRKTPAQIAQAVKYAKEADGKKGLTPEKVVGKKRLVVYDIEKRKLKQYYAIGQGFTFTGTTLKNVGDSIEKTARKPEIVFADTGIQYLGRVLKGIKGKSRVPRTRFNENTLILAVS